MKPLLFVVIDTEEEFDWGAPFSRQNQSVTAMRHIGRAQSIFDRYSIRPTYVVDYPVASKRDGYQPLGEVWGDGRCAIGAHVHPWVNPPYREQLCGANSFLCNLPRFLQRDKVRVLRDAIETNLHVSPRVFKAGRYGFGTSTTKVLSELHFLVDTSYSPRFTFAAEGGPDFSAHDSQPFFLTDTLLEVPCTVDYVGWAGRWQAPLYSLANRTALRQLRAPGILARARAVNRIMLSPEGNTFEEMRDLTRSLLAAGQRTFTLSFHSPSLDVGHSPYVRTRHDLDEFLRRIESYCAFFVSDVGGLPATLEDFRLSLLNERSGA